MMMPEKPSPPDAAESVDERLAVATPEQVARAIFAAVEPPDPSKRQPKALAPPGRSQGPTNVTV